MKHKISLYKISIYKEPASTDLIIPGQTKDLTAQQETKYYIEKLYTIKSLQNATTDSTAAK